MIALNSSPSGLLNRRGYLYRLGTPETESDIQRVERRVACARALVAVSCLLLIWMSPTQAALRKGPAILLLCCYGAYSLLLILWMLWRPHVRQSFRSALHATDVLLVTSFFTLTQGPNATSLVLFFFLLTAAAVRWAHWGTVATAVAAIVLVFLGTVTQNRTPASVLNSHFLTQAGYLLIIGFSLGMLSEKLKGLRAESALIDRLFGFIDTEADFQRTIERVCTEVARVFDARKVLLAVREGASGPMFLWQSARGTRAAVFRSGDLLERRVLLSDRCMPALRFHKFGPFQAYP